MKRAAAVLFLLGGLGSGQGDDARRFRECTFPWVPWADTVEDALERARRERRLVVAFVFPWDGTAYEAGYEGADRVRARPPVPTPQEAEQRLKLDPGFVKEQAVLTALLGNPEFSALIARRCVPVRLRLHTWHFFDGGPGPFADPLPRLGTSDRETRPPAIVFATADGKLLHRVERMGVFNPYLVHRILLAVLRKNPKYLAGGLPPEGAEPRAAAEQLAAGGDFDRARKRLDKAGGAPWTVLARARMDAIEGNLTAAEAAVRGVAADAERDRLLREILVRLGRCEEVAAMAKPEDAASRAALAYALGRLRRADEARAVWEEVLRAPGHEGLAARARLHLAEDGPLAREWETLEEHPALALPGTTVGGQGNDVSAVRYLLSQQAPDGSWRDPRAAQGFDLSVPRTALCVCALRAWREAAGKEADDAIAKGVAYVTAWSAAPQERVWDLTYALHLELELHAESPSPEGARRIEGLLAALGRIEHDGGWTYTGPPRCHTFNTAPILILLARARELGLAVDEERMARAARFLERNRLGRGSLFHYGTTMEHMTEEKGPKAEKSSCLRSPLCELALRAAGFEKDGRGLARAIDLFLEHHASARATQKIFESYVDVTNMQDSYRYFFGVYYASRGIRLLPEKQRRKLAAELDAAVRACQEIDGSYVDSQMIGKASSTALALLALAELRAARS